MALLITLSVDQYYIITDIGFHDLANLRISGSGVKGNRQNQLIPCGQVRGKIKRFEQRFNFLVCERFNQHLALTLPVDFNCGIGGDIFLAVGILKKRSQAFQNAVDVAWRQLLAQKILGVLFDVLRTNHFKFRHGFMFLQVVEEQRRTVVIALCGSWTEPAQVTFHLKFF